MPVVAIGGSAGGIQALIDVVRTLPADLDATVAVVIHTSVRAPAVLPTILRRHTALPVDYVVDAQPLQPGRIVLAPPDRHLVITDTHVGLGNGPRENSHRPSIDVLFRSAAVALGDEVTAVVLSGVLDDGAAGAVAVAARGGRVVVQSPDDALYGTMPANALARVPQAVVAPAQQLGGVIAQLVSTPGAGRMGPPPGGWVREAEIAALRPGDRPPLQDHPSGTPSAFACPDCHGVLWQTRDGDVVRYRCRVGHAWSGHSLAAQQDTAVESALWTALRALEERAELTANLQRDAERDGRSHSAAQFAQRTQEAHAHAAAIRGLLVDRDPPVVEEPTADEAV